MSAVRVHVCIRPTSPVYDLHVRKPNDFAITFGMVRIREIDDPELRAKVIAKLAEWRGLAPGSVPTWFELDDADYVDLLNAIAEDENPRDPEAEYRD